MAQFMVSTGAWDPDDSKISLPGSSLASYAKKSWNFLLATQPVAIAKFCEQIRDSARSAPSNIAEGFGRFYPREFSRFLSIAAGSIQETRNHIIEAHQRGHLSTTELDRLTRLSLRAFKAVTQLAKYLRQAQPPPS